jgi:hypothetical protein
MRKDVAMYIREEERRRGEEDEHELKVHTDGKSEKRSQIYTVKREAAV